MWRGLTVLLAARHGRDEETDSPVWTVTCRRPSILANPACRVDLDHDGGVDK